MTPRILVVDDEPDVQDLIKRRFRQQIRQGEYQFDFALDGREALDRIEAEDRFDIVLSDINMPRMDGLTLLDHLREHTGMMKTIMVSAYGDMDNIRTAMNRGAFDFVTKPINFDDLAATIEKSLDELKYLKEIINRLSQAETDNKYMEGELQIGRKIQSGFLPSETPDVPGWNITPYFRSAREVAGDFYDVFNIDGHSRIGLVVADVCDKGVGAALFMTLFRSLLRSTAKMHEYIGAQEKSNALYHDKPDHLLKQCVQFTNNYIAATHGHTSMFATLFFGLLEPETGHLYYINAGHEEPLIIRADGTVDKLENTGPVVGLFQNSDYGIGETQLETGEILTAYTDGITDAANAAGAPFTTDRLIDILKSNPTDQIATTLAHNIQEYMGDAPQFDDITFLTLSRE